MRRAVVTGAAGSLGRAVAERLGSERWQVISIDLVNHFSVNTADAFGGVDLTDEAAVRSVAAAIADRFGAIDAIVNIAGGFVWETVLDGGIDTWDRLYAMNLRTAVIVSQSLLPMLRKPGGAIVNVGAAAAAKAATGMGAYAASKAGVARLTEALAEELKDAGIRVNAVLPSIIDTVANRLEMPDADHARWVAPARLATVISFLLSDGAEAITGALIPVNGGI